MRPTCRYNTLITHFYDGETSATFYSTKIIWNCDRNPLNYPVLEAFSQDTFPTNSSNNLMLLEGLNARCPRINHKRLCSIIVSNNYLLQRFYVLAFLTFSYYYTTHLKTYIILSGFKTPFLIQRLHILWDAVLLETGYRQTSIIIGNDCFKLALTSMNKN